MEEILCVFLVEGINILTIFNILSIIENGRSKERGSSEKSSARLLGKVSYSGIWTALAPKNYTIGSIRKNHFMKGTMKMKKIKYYFGIGLISALGLLGAGVIAGLTPVYAESTSETSSATAVPSIEPSTAPVVTASPVPLPTATPTAKPTPTLTPRPTPKPTPQVPTLKKVKGVKLTRYSTHAVKVTWKKHKKAKYYRVYYSKKKNGKYRLAGTTKHRRFLVNKLKNKKTYYFYVQACRKRKASPSDSAPSVKKKMTMKSYRRKIIFAGDSICQGVGYGQSFPNMHSSARKKVVAYRGLNTVTFHTKRIFGRRTGLQKVIEQKPYRVYMMLGMNEIHYRKARLMIAEYKDLIKNIQQASPHTDIVLCAVSPVTRAERARHPGMWQIPVFNKKLKKLAKKMGVRYFDYTGFLKDSGGYLKAQYAEGDGYHWKASAYVKFGKVVGKYDKSLDR